MAEQIFIPIGGGGGLVDKLIEYRVTHALCHPDELPEYQILEHEGNEPDWLSKNEFEVGYIDGTTTRDIGENYIYLEAGLSSEVTAVTKSTVDLSEIKGFTVIVEQGEGSTGLLFLCISSSKMSSHQFYELRLEIPHDFAGDFPVLNIESLTTHNWYVRLHAVDGFKGTITAIYGYCAPNIADYTDSLYLPPGCTKAKFRTNKIAIPPEMHAWDGIVLNKNMPPNTEIKVDLLDGEDQLISENISTASWLSKSFLPVGEQEIGFEVLLERNSQDDDSPRLEGGNVRWYELRK